jgi:large subunit ribosomal protein L19e
MADLKYHRRLAAELLKCGRHRVRFDWQRIDDVAEAVTRSDVRKLIISGAIYKAQKKGSSRGRTNYRKFQKSKGRRRGHGKRKGTFKARNPKKRRWIMTIRPIRRRLRTLRNKGRIDKSTYRTYYRQAKGGIFKSKSHLNQQLKLKKVIKAKKKKVKKEKEA